MSGLYSKTFCKILLLIGLISFTDSSRHGRHHEAQDFSTSRRHSHRPSSHSHHSHHNRDAYLSEELAINEEDDSHFDKRGSPPKFTKANAPEVKDSAKPKPDKGGKSPAGVQGGKGKGMTKIEKASANSASSKNSSSSAAMSKTAKWGANSGAGSSSFSNSSKSASSQSASSSSKSLKVVKVGRKAGDATTKKPKKP